MRLQVGNCQIRSELVQFRFDYISNSATRKCPEPSQLALPNSEVHGYHF
ncbi:hypothetical protein VCSRO210_2716 [Vibrio cholerae]|nr:hypothetical protein VCSRO210_2716 [Vibrio cholerae]